MPPPALRNRLKSHRGRGSPRPANSGNRPADPKIIIDVESYPAHPPPDQVEPSTKRSRSVDIGLLFRSDSVDTAYFQPAVHAEAQLRTSSSLDRRAIFDWTGITVSGSQPACRGCSS